MTDPQIRIHDDPGALVGDLASALLARLEEAQSRGEVPQIGLTGGTIADELHRELARRAAHSSVDWARVVFWWGDERFVAANSPDRNARQARDALLDHLPVEAANVHEVPASDQVATAEDAATSYGASIRSDGAGAFEVLMLGVGPDGHCASLFPGHPALEATDAIAVAVHDSPKPPPDRITLTFEALNRSKAVWFLASGDSKADAVARALAIQGSVQETPARGVRGLEETIWWLDTASASRHSRRHKPAEQALRQAHKPAEQALPQAQTRRAGTPAGTNPPSGHSGRQGQLATTPGTHIPWAIRA